MTKAKDQGLRRSRDIRPYVERAMNDEKLRGDVLSAFGTAREVYGELIGETDRPIAIASRVATDDEIRDKLRDAIEDLRSASDRLQGKKERSRRPESALLIAGLALGILFNPVTGAETRRFIKDLITGGSSDQPLTSSNGNS